MQKLKLKKKKTKYIQKLKIEEKDMFSLTFDLKTMNVVLNGV